MYSASCSLLPAVTYTPASCSMYSASCSLLPAVTYILPAVQFCQLFFTPSCYIYPRQLFYSILPAVLYSQLLHISCQLLYSASCSLLTAARSCQLIYSPSRSTVYIYYFYLPSCFYSVSCYLLTAVLFILSADPFCS